MVNAKIIVGRTLHHANHFQVFAGGPLPVRLRPAQARDRVAPGAKVRASKGARGLQ